jgi:hypothetical protein
MRSPTKLGYKIKAETAEELDQVQTIAGIRNRINEARFYDPLVRQVFRLAKIENLGDEDTFTLLAYHSLVAKENLQNSFLEHLQTTPKPPFFVLPGIKRREHLAVLMLLVRRATLLDRWRARKIPGHWLNAARREILIG